MLARDVRVEDFDTPDWLALGDILAARALARPSAEYGGVIALVEGDRVLKLLSLEKGRLNPADAASSTLPELAAKFGASFVIRVSRTALLEFSDRFSAAVTRTDDLYAQAQKASKIAGELVEEGQLEVYPHRAWMFALPTSRAVGRVLDAICPVGKALLFGAFENGEVETSIALRRGKDGFDRLVGPEQVRRELGLRTGDFRDDARKLARAVELAVAPVSLGVFAESRTFKEILADRTPGAWTAAIVARDVVLHPVVPAIAIPLGVDVGRVAWAAARELATRFNLGAWVSPEGPFRATFDRVRDAVPGAEAFRALGFDPFALLRELFDPKTPRD